MKNRDIRMYREREVVELRNPASDSAPAAVIEVAGRASVAVASTHSLWVSEIANALADHGRAGR